MHHATNLHPLLENEVLRSPAAVASTAPMSYNLRQPDTHNQFPPFYNANGGPPHSQPFFAQSKLLDYRSVSADDDEDDDSLVILCGTGARAADANPQHGNGEEPTEPREAFAGGASTSEDSFEEDQEFLELQEREQIVDKYEKGPDRADVDPWENPDFELHRTTDRYGFVHKDLTAEQLAEHKRVHKELKRERKWLRMLEEWEKRHPAKLSERIWKGVPDTLRLLIWKKLLGSEAMKNSSRENLYDELLKRARLVSKDIKQIDLDINRTYRDNVAFRRRYDVKQRSLFNVLTAYAMLNTEVGYCQGMSQIAALFLMYMDEEDAFWSLHALLVNRKYGMHGFFVPGFPKLQRFQQHYDKMLLKYLPRVKKHLDNMGIPPIYLTKWWFGCFLDRVPFPLALRIWDVFLYFGDCILVAMAYNIMKMHRKRILKLSVEEFMEFIQSALAEDFGFSDDAVMESLSECLKRLQNDRMAIPPHPMNTNAPAELPTKPLGPILTRSMLDIREDINSVYSRCSRANSLCGRSPLIRRHHTQHGSTPPSSVHHQKLISSLASARLQQQLQQQHSPVSQQQQTATNLSRAVEGDESRPGSLKDQQQKQRGSGSTTPQQVVGQQVVEQVDGVPVEPFLRRVGSTKHRIQKPPPVPDEDGFVRMGPRHASKQSQQHQQRNTEEAVACNATTTATNQESAASSMHARQPSQYDNVAQQQQQRVAEQQHPKSVRAVPNANNVSRLPQPRSGSVKTQNQQQMRTSTEHQQRTDQRPQPSMAHQQPQPTATEHRKHWSMDSGSTNHSGNSGGAGRHRVHRAANNITYISVEEGEEEEDNNHNRVLKQQEQPVPATQQQPQSRQPTMPRQSERVPSRLPYYCPPPDYDELPSNSVGGRTASSISNSSRSHHWQPRGNNAAGVNRWASERQQPTNRQRTAAPMARPLYAHEETAVVRRF